MAPPSASVLLVDDQPENLLALETILAPLGQELVTAGSGEEALKRLLQGEFAVVLLDIRMPGLDGPQTAEHIKRREKTKHVPIIFLTAGDREKDELLRAYSAGAVDYIYKPFDPTILRSKVGVFIDLYHMKRQAEELAHRALHDALTGLPNRVLFLDRLEVALARTKRRSATVGVFYFDIDGFKAVNDALGHEAGDQLLTEVARRVKGILRPADTVARLGGDEFAAVCEGNVDERVLVDAAERISKALAAPVDLDGTAVSVTASIGLTLASGDHGDADTLVREADAAMYRAKRAGGARHELWDDRMRRRVQRQLETEQALGRALERDELRLHYQPISDAQVGRIAGVEALVRWQHPERGLIGPDEFIPLAERTGQIVRMGSWVLRQALEQAAEWRAERPDDRPLTMSVNLSARQLAQQDLVEVVAKALEDTGTFPAQLCFEITESVAMADAGTMVPALGELKALGVKIALDDFGTGYSSLSHLKGFPLDILKVDRSFVDGIDRNWVNRSIVAAVISLAGALGVTTVGEGVETTAQLEELTALSCDLIQGYWLARPQPPERMVELLRDDGVGRSRGAVSGSSRR
jgi:diguanylate cyclase (GGDEF)-like protein